MIQTVICLCIYVIDLRILSIHWGFHVFGWWRKSKEVDASIECVKYEDLLRMPTDTFAKAILEKYGAVD